MLILSAAAFVICTGLLVHGAFKVKPYWGLLALFAPPSWPIFYAEHWKKFRLIGIFHLTSFVALLFATTFYVRAYPFEFDGTLLAPLRDHLAPAFASQPLSLEKRSFASEETLLAHSDKLKSRTVLNFRGRLVEMGQATFSDGILRMHSEPNRKPQIELAIDLRATGLYTGGATVLDLSPDSIDHPSVYIFEYAHRYTLPVITAYDGGFWLTMSLNRDDQSGDIQNLETQNQGYQSKVKGDIQLRLPDEDQSYVAGHFAASRKDLRWEIGNVRRDHDSNDTIEYVAQQYIENKLGNSLSQIISFRKTFYQTALDEATGSTLATLAMNDGSVQYLELSLYKDKDAGWIVEQQTREGLVAALNTIDNMPAGAVPQLAPVRSREFSVEHADSLMGNNVMVFTRNGRSKEGIITSVDRHNLCLTLPLEGNEMVMMIRREDVRKIQLME